MVDIHGEYEKNVYWNLAVNQGHGFASKISRSEPYMQVDGCSVLK